MSQVRDTAKELIEKSDDSMPDLQSQLIELTTSWDRVTKQADRRQLRIQDAIKMADDFSRNANAFLEWVSDCEFQLKFDPDLVDDESALQLALDKHKVGLITLNTDTKHRLLCLTCHVYSQAFVEEIGHQRKNLTDTLSLGEAILSKSHQEAVPVMKRWLLVLKQRMEDVDVWSNNFERAIQVCSAVLIRHQLES